MKLQIADLTTDRQWCAATGFTAEQFAKLLILFTQSYFELYGQTVAQRHVELEVTPTLTSGDRIKSGGNSLREWERKSVSLMNH